MSFFKKVRLFLLLSLVFVANTPLHAMEEPMATYGDGDDETNTEERVAPPHAKRRRSLNARHVRRIRPATEAAEEDVEEVGTPPEPSTPKAPTHRVAIPMECNNYCAQLLDALIAADATEETVTTTIKEALKGLLTNNPYTMQDFSTNTFAYYQALSYVICKSICLCSRSKRRISKPISIFGTISDGPIALSLKYRDHIYVLQFITGEEAANPTLLTYSYRDSTDNITILSIHHVISPPRFIIKRGSAKQQCIGSRYLGAKIRILENTGEKAFEIKTPLELVDCHPGESLFQQEGNIFAQAIANITQTHHLSNLLTELYSVPAQRWGFRIEKPYQALFANAMRFVGIGLVQTEVPTWNGRTDCVIYPAAGDPIIIEFKYNASNGARDALEQIKDREYYTQVIGDASLIGINTALPAREATPINIDVAYEAHHKIIGPSPAKKATPAGEKSGTFYRRRLSESARRRLQHTTAPDDDVMTNLWDR